MKTCCIFAPAFANKCFGRRTRLFGQCPKVLKQDISEVKEYYNEQKNISAIKEKKEKQTRFQGAYGFCERKKSIGRPQSERQKEAIRIF